MDDLRISPLQHLHHRLAEAGSDGPRGVRLRELAFSTQIGLRAEPGSAAHQRLAEVLGGLPGAVGETTGSPQQTATLWLAPDEFLTIAAPDSEHLLDQLKEALGDDPGQVVDLSANRTTVELIGGAARETLEKGVPADLHLRSFGIGQAVTTTLGPVPVLLWRTGENSFRVLLRSSYAEYLAHWLLDAVREFQVTS